MASRPQSQQLDFGFRRARSDAEIRFICVSVAADDLNAMGEARRKSVESLLRQYFWDRKGRHAKTFSAFIPVFYAEAVAGTHLRPCYVRP